MRTITFAFVVWFVFLTGYALADQQFPPEETLAPVERVFVPSGFDDNDVSEVVVQGVFPNSCYRTWRNGYTIDESSRTITVWVTAYMHKSLLCAQVMTPYIVPVKLGILKVGSYEVKALGLSGESPSLKIKERTVESPDDFLYAPVEGANVESDENGRQYLQIFGRFPLLKRGCLKIEEVVQEDVENDVLVVLPVMKELYGDACNDATDAFNLKVGLKAHLEGDKLLHVRSINGNSYNRFIQN
ncbi:MAG: hypothetical protein R3B45_07980 [Bdellovibrionota bacterium]